MSSFGDEVEISPYLVSDDQHALIMQQVNEQTSLLFSEKDQHVSSIQAILRQTESFQEMISDLEKNIAGIKQSVISQSDQGALKANLNQIEKSLTAQLQQPGLPDTAYWRHVVFLKLIELALEPSLQLAAANCEDVESLVKTVESYKTKRQEARVAQANRLQKIISDYAVALQEVSTKKI